MSLTVPSKFFLRVLIAGAAFVPLCGCNQNELRARVEQVEARVNAAPPEQQQPKPAVISAPSIPLRRSAETLDDWNRKINGELLAAAAGVGMVFHAEVLDNDDVRIVSAKAPFGKETADFLKSLNFQNNADVWTRRFRRREIDDTDAKIRKKLSQVEQDLQSAVSETSRLYPGKAAVTAEHKPVAGALVYTGNAQDVAVSPSAPDVFILTSAKVYVRGGRLSVGGDGVIKLDGASLNDMGIKEVPADAASMGVSGDGTISANSINGVQSNLGRLLVVQIKEVDALGGGFVPHAGATVNAQPAGSPPLLPGHLEVPDVAAKLEALHLQLRAKAALVSLLESFTSVEEPTPSTTPVEAPRVPLVLHSAMQQRTVEHLKALRVPITVAGDAATVGQGSTAEQLVPAMAIALNGLKRSMALHEENMPHAGKARDLEGRLSPYRRKYIEIEKGEAVEKTDMSELPKNYKPGDPDAGADGNVVLSNVNRAAEISEYKRDIEDYKMLREALLRLDARQVFPEAPKGP